MKIALGGGFVTEQEAKKFAIGIVSRLDPSENPKLLTEKGRKELIEEYASSLYYFQDKEKDAYGGRVGRMMGSPMTGEQPMTNPMSVERQDVAMETQDQGNDAYAMLRAVSYTHLPSPRDGLLSRMPSSA